MFVYEQSVIVLHELVSGEAFEAADDMETCQANTGSILSISKVRRKKNKNNLLASRDGVLLCMFSCMCLQLCELRREPVMDERGTPFM